MNLYLTVGEISTSVHQAVIQSHKDTLLNLFKVQVLGELGRLFLLVGEFG